MPTGPENPIWLIAVTVMVLVAVPVAMVAMEMASVEVMANSLHNKP